jgi:FKBP-type peptidyl-prolyl cis-trans isomerase (trigger factor)
MEFKSKIKRIKDPDTSKELVISNLYADKQMIEAHRQRLVNIFKNDTPQQIDQKISNIVIRDNVFNAAMNEIVKSYEINYDEEEISNAIVKIKPQFADASDEKLKNIAQKLIAKALIFRDLADT